MWCRHCQQDVPAVVSTRGDQQLCCPRCTNAFATPDEAMPHFEPDWAAEMWELEEDLHELDRLLGSQTADTRSPFTAARTDSPHIREPESQTLAPQNESRERLPPEDPRLGWRTKLGWLLVLPGTAVLAAGGAFVGWALWSGVDAYWRSGAPLLLAGQAMVMLGVMLCLDAAAKARMTHSQALEALSRQLERPATAAVPPPHQLLADIKAQLDRIPAE